MEKAWPKELIEHLHQRHANNNQGEVATYIPELGNANPDDFGIAMTTASGEQYATGTFDKEFTIQSISKPFTYGMALELYGYTHVSRFVGVEPSGDAFNSIVLETETHRPFNPMVNAGAIATTGMLYRKYGDETIDRILHKLSEAAGRQLSIDDSVYQSEARTGHRNRAIGHLLLNFEKVPDDIEAVLDVYFKQCSILVNCQDLSVMSATLANLGTNPLTGKEVYLMDRVKKMLSIMLTCGMYDYSGEWAYNVGIPAKSGVSGGVMAVVNRQLGIATYSPRLDKRGNSCRGIEVCIEMAEELGLHAFDCMNQGSSYLQAVL
jgi:glutaminase